MTILITGAAGFIGFSLFKRLLEQKQEVIGFDNLNNYYDINLKKSRVEKLKKVAQENGTAFNLILGNLEDKESVENLFSKFKPKIVINLAAQAGVRYSIENPHAYIDSNILGFLNILEGCKELKVEHLIYASSSSIYGGNINMPFKETQGVDHPVSLYAATKKSNEMMAHCYSHLHSIPSTGLRFFTVYGPWGRPDMALFLFTKSIIEGQPINVFNNGDMIRDFTYIDDVIESLVRLINKPPSADNKFNKEDPNPSKSWAPYRIFNVGNSNPIPLMDYISTLEEVIGKKAKKNFLPMQPGDVKATSASTSALEEYIGFKPKTSIKKGITEFVTWYRNFYKI